MSSNIRYIREAKDISRVELSKLSGVSEPMLKILESDKFDILNSKLDTLVKISKALRVKVIDLLPVEKRTWIK